MICDKCGHANEEIEEMGLIWNRDYKCFNKVIRFVNTGKIQISTIQVKPEDVDQD